MRTQLYLTPKDQGRPLTLDEFEHADAREGYRYELIDGRLEVSPVPELPHDHLMDWLHKLLLEYATQHSEIINRISASARVFVPGRRATTAPQPDLAAYHNYPYRGAIRLLRWQEISPVLVVEILSADSAPKDLVRNRRLYRQVPSIREYWILDPRADADHPSLTIYRRRGQSWQQPIRVAFGEVYTTRLLPEFRLLLDPHAGEEPEED
jgi:Uma2 family endonuclease